MSKTVDAVYENGVFRPLDPVDLPEHQRVTIPLPETNGSSTEENKSSGDWTEEKNERRCDLIDKQIEGTLTEPEKAELADLQQQAIKYRDRVAPLPLQGALELHRELLEKKRASQE